MIFNLNLRRKHSEITRDASPPFHVDGLEHDYKIYLFLCKDAIDTNNIEKLLERLETTNKDVWVKVLDAHDPFFERTIRTFELNTLPGIILTANKKLASMDYPSYSETAYVIIKGKELFKSEDLTLEITKELVHLFKKKQVHKFLKKTKDAYGDEKDVILRQLILNKLREKVNSLPENAIAIDTIHGQFELTDYS